MKKNVISFIIIFCCLIFLLQKIIAQQPVVMYKKPILKIDFGNASNTVVPNIGYLQNYEKVEGVCPNDGHYSFKLQPPHELVMVANNLGSIPPNTSLMIITANDKRYEVFISSSEQKNARVINDLKK